MKIITDKQIKALNINPITCMEWVKESFASKKYSQLPPKPSVHPGGIDFFTTMPCLLGDETGNYQRFGVKVVHRLENAVPTLGSDILLYEAKTGELLALIDGDWITTMRTGAVANMAIDTLCSSEFKISPKGKIGLMGLGNTARATILCLLESQPSKTHHISLLKYKDQADLFIRRFSGYKNVNFTVVDNIPDLVKDADVIISCITQATANLCEDDNLFKPGCLVVPVHTRGFQNCDLSFDKVFADDTAHVRGFKYFNQFKFFGELQDVIEGKIEGRLNGTERILSYNIGLGLHDVFFANKIYNMMQNEEIMNIEWLKETDKFWM